MTKAHHSQQECAGSLNQHRGLKLFDATRNKKRVHFQRSRIPVPAPRSQLSEEAEAPNQTALNYKIDRQGSKIPVHKSALTGPRDFLAEEEMPFSRTQNSNGSKSLRLRGLELSTLPKSVFNHTDVESLILSPEREACLEFKLSSLPKEIGNLRNLRTLVLDTNELSSIPNEVCGLVHLEAIALSNNCLTELPEQFFRLEKLSSLHLANNRFTEVPQSVCSLKSLGFLDMSDNAVLQVPPEIGNLAGHLHSFLLFMNDINQLPKEISLLTSLRCLWLGENKLTELPSDFGELFRLDWGSNPCSSNIEGNPLVNPPLIVCRLGPSAIREYFHKQRESEKIKPLRPALSRKKQTLMSGW